MLSYERFPHIGMSFWRSFWISGEGKETNLEKLSQGWDDPATCRRYHECCINEWCLPPEAPCLAHPRRTYRMFQTVLFFSFSFAVVVSRHLWVVPLHWKIPHEILLSHRLYNKSGPTIGSHSKIRNGIVPTEHGTASFDHSYSKVLKISKDLARVVSWISMNSSFSSQGKNHLKVWKQRSLH